MSDYGADFWNSKWPKAPILYSGRALRGKKDNIAVDVRAFILTNDEIVNQVIDKYNLKGQNDNETAYNCQNFVCKFLTYKYDDDSNKCPEFWQFPFETLQSSIGDCEDGAILIASLLINCGVPSWKVKVAAGDVIIDNKVAKTGGHAYCLFLADRIETDRKLEWVILDWCYYPDQKVKCDKKPLAKDGGFQSCYKEVWFTFNNEYSWNQESLTIDGTSLRSKKKSLNEDALLKKSEISLKSIIKNVDAKIKAKKK
jgi:transglutaminase-like putative cysteine protease